MSLGRPTVPQELAYWNYSSTKFDVKSLSKFTMKLSIQKTIFYVSLRCSVFATALVPLATTAAPGDLYVAGGVTEGRGVYRFTPDGTRNVVFSGEEPGALAFDARGNLYLGRSAETCPPSFPPVEGCTKEPAVILRLTPNGTQSTFATVDSISIYAMAFDGAGNLFVSTGPGILKFAPDGTRSRFASQLDGVWPLAFDSSGNLYAAVNPIGPSSILRFAPDGTSSTFVAFSGPGSSVTALAFSAEGDLFAKRGDSILRIRPDGTSTTFAEDQFAPTLAFDSTGNLFAGQNATAEDEPAIIEFRPDGTSRTFAFGVLLPTAFAFEPVVEKLHNLSARGLVQTGDNVLIAGFILGGNALTNNAVVVRAVGPSLSNAGITNPLSDPTLEIRNSAGELIATNNDWQDRQQAELTAIGLSPGHARDSAIYALLPAGAYTAIVRGVGNATGTAVVEIYNVRK